MSRTPLELYLNDHLAGSVGAVELVEHLTHRTAGTELEGFFRELKREIEGDQNVLEHLLTSTGGKESGLKQAAAWVTEKAAAAKLRFAGTARRELELFEALESLALGVLGKRALWRALAVVAPETQLLRGHDFEALIRRADDQYSRIEARRITVARDALLGD